MSAATPEGGPYRELARRTLDQGAQELNVMPAGPMPTDELHARSAKAQAVAALAVGWALIEIGDVLRAALKESADE